MQALVVALALALCSACALSQSVPDLNQARALVRRGNFDAALLDYQTLLAKNPKSAEAYAGLAHLYLKMTDVHQAAETVAKGLQQIDDWPLHIALGEVEFRQGKIPESEKEFVAVINSGRRNARAYLGLARVRWAISMNKSAKSLIDQAHELDPDDTEIEQFWVKTLNPEDRIKYLKQPLTRPPDSNSNENVPPRILGDLKLPAAQPECRLVSKVTSTQTPLVRMFNDPVHIRGYGLSVEVNGQKTRLLLDTGSSGILINSRAAEKAGVTPLSSTVIGGVGDNGTQSGYTGLAHSIKIGSLEFQDCPVDVWDGRSVVGEEGLIGADVFQNFLVELDFPKEKLRLSDLPRKDLPKRDLSKHLEEKSATGRRQSRTASKEPTAEGNSITLQSASAEPPISGAGDASDLASSPPAEGAGEPQDRYIAPEMKSYTQVYRFGHNLLVPTKVGDTPYKLFLIDTGALENQITPEAAREVTKVRSEYETKVKGLSGSVKNLYTADKAMLQFGHLRQENQDLLTFDLSAISDSIGAEVSGTLGFAMLSLLDLKIDYRDGLVDFNYKEKPWPSP